MRKNFDAIIVIATAIVLIALATIIIGSYAKAEEPQVVEIRVLPTPTPKPVPKPMSEDIPQYNLDSSDVKRIARLLWSSPLRSDGEKTKLVWLVLNRVDEGGVFGSTVHDVINTTEFPWYDKHARVSDKNRKLVEREMNLWLAEKDGYSIGRRPPRTALYAMFSGDGNRQIELKNEEGEIVW